MTTKESTATNISRGQLILFTVLACVLFFAAVEVLLRVYVAWRLTHEPGRQLPPPAQRHAYQTPDAEFGYVLLPGYNEGGIRINGLGLRGADISPAKSRGVGRIISIGDSTTFGLTGEDCPYPAKLQKRLNSGSTSKFEVVNAGVEGYSLRQARKLLNRRLQALSPDIVTVYIGWNDIYLMNPFRANELPFHEQLVEGNKPSGAAEFDAMTRIARLLDHIYLAQAIRRFIYLSLPRMVASTRSTDANRAIDPRMSNEFAQGLTRLVAEIKAANATPVLMTLPSILAGEMPREDLALVHYPTWAASDYRLFKRVVDKINETIRLVAGQHRIALVDNAKFIDALGKPKNTLFFDTLHMYCDGNELIAENIARELSRQGLIKQIKGD